MYKYKKDKQGNLLLTNKQAAELYREWFNNYITLKKFSFDLNTTMRDALNIINRGRIHHENKLTK